LHGKSCHPLFLKDGVFPAAVVFQVALLMEQNEKRANIDRMMIQVRIFALL
jgi:hypothetical protein